MTTKNNGSQKQAQAAQASEAEQPEAEFKFDRIYFDTNSLWAENWPAPSTSLKNVFGLAAELGISCHIPEPVLTELEEKWFRELDDAREQLNRCLRRIGAPEVRVFDERATAAAQYRERCQKEMELARVERSPLTERSLAEVVRMCAAHQPPFDSDREFRDRVIWLSLIDNLSKSSNATALFVSADKEFEGKGFRDLAAQGRTEVRVHKGIGGVLEALRKSKTFKQRADFIRAWLHDINLATAAAREPEASRKIEDFIAANFEIASATLKAVKRLRVIAIEEAETALPTDENGKFDISKGLKRNPGSRVEVSVKAKVELEVRARGSIFAPFLPQPLKVGEEEKPSALSSLMDSEEEDQIWTKTVKVEATAIYQPEGYSDFQPVSLQLLEDNEK